MRPDTLVPLLLPFLACVAAIPISPSTHRVSLQVAAAPAPGLAPPWTVGCAEVDVTISRSQGKDIVTVSVQDRGCGPLRATVDTVAFKAGSNQNPTVSLPIAVVNTDSWQIQSAQIVSWPDSLALIDPTSLPGTPLAWLNADSVVAPGAAELPGARFWNQPSVMIDSMGSQTFGRTWLQVAIHKDVKQFKAWIWIRGASVVGQVPSRPPARYPDDLFMNYDSEWKVPYDVIGLDFLRGTSQADREAAIAAVSGEVIGGIPYRGVVFDGIYLIRIPSEGVTETLIPAIELLRSLPQVRDAEMYIETGPAYRLPPSQGWRVRPVDGFPRELR